MASSATLQGWLSDVGYEQPVSSSGLVHLRKLAIGKQVKHVAFSVVENSHKLKAACDLLNERYGWRGYGSSHVIPCGTHHTTFMAEVDEEVVGTITLAIDSAQGLAIDNTFKVEADQARLAPRAQICELTKLAFDPGIRSKDVLAGLFHLAFIYGTNVSECTDLFIEVNPRHASFYEAMLGFERLGPLKPNVSVGAPSQLMRLKVDAIADSIGRMAGTAGLSACRSLYPHFFPPQQELQIRRSLLLNQRMRRVRFDSLDVEPTAAAEGADLAAAAPLEAPSRPAARKPVAKSGEGVRHAA